MQFVYNHFERAARAQANGLGAPDLKIYVFPQYKPGEAYSPEEAEKAIKAAAEFPKLPIGKTKDSLARQDWAACRNCSTLLRALIDRGKYRDVDTVSFPCSTFNELNPTPPSAKRALD